MLPLTVLALVSLILRRAATGWLVAPVDRAVSSIQAVVLTGVAVTVGPCEAHWASAGWSTWDNGYEVRYEKLTATVFTQAIVIHLVFYRM